MLDANATPPIRPADRLLQFARDLEAASQAAYLRALVTQHPRIDEYRIAYERAARLRERLEYENLPLVRRWVRRLLEGAPPAGAR